MTKTQKAEFLSVTEAAERLGLPRQTVYGWTSKGVIPSVQVGGRVLIPLDDFRRVLEKGRRTTQSA